MVNQNKIVLLGGGGHARVVIDLIRISGIYEIIGILDSQLEVGSSVSGISVLGNDTLLSDLYNKGIRNACIAIGSVKDNSRRKILYEKVKQVGFSVPSLLHPQSIVSKYNTKIYEGVQIMAGAIVQTCCSIGENTIVNTGAVIEHDCVVGNHVQISPGAVISGGCVISNSAFVGTGATMIHSIKIGSNSVVSAGAVVVNNVPDNTRVMGVPAK
jgi:UDP-perosamine 4-acetyltransferase